MAKMFNLDEDLHLEPEALQQQLSQVGMIVVCLERAVSKPLVHPQEQISIDPRPVGQLDKKLLLKNVSNTLK